MSSRLEGRQSNDFSRSQGRWRQGLQEVLDARRMDASLPAQGWRGEMRCPGTCFALHHLVPTWGREHCVLDEIPCGEQGLQLVSRWAHRKMPPLGFFFLPAREQRIDRGRGSPSLVLPRRVVKMSSQALKQPLV